MTHHEKAIIESRTFFSQWTSSAIKKILINLQLFRNQQWVMNLKALASIKMNSSPNSNNNAKLKWTRMRKRTGLPHEGFWLLQVTEIGKNSSSWCGPGSELGPKTERQNVSIHFWHVCLFFYNWLVFSFLQLFVVVAVVVILVQF